MEEKYETHINYMYCTLFNNSYISNEILTVICNSSGADVCHLIMKQNLFWGEEIVREFFVNFCFEKSSQLLHNYALVFSCQ